jgi:hypothetical protein
VQRQKTQPEGCHPFVAKSFNRELRNTFFRAPIAVRVLQYAQQ